MNDEFLVDMPIDFFKENSNYYVTVLRTPKRYYSEPFFLDSLRLNYHISLEKNNTTYDNDLVRNLNYSTAENIIRILSLEQFVKEANANIANNIVFIFHASRCGSTLVTQMLSQSEKFFVISEPPIINKILDPKLDLPESVFYKLLYLSINAINNCAPDKSIKTIIKFRSWNTLFLENIISLFPNSPWIFIHRHGGEILASLLHRECGWLRVQKTYSEFYSKHLSLNKEYILNCTSEEFIGQFLRHLFSVAKKNQSRKSFFIDYKFLPHILFSFLNICNLNLTVNEKRKMLDSTKIYSKDPKRKTKFVSDSESKKKLLTQKQLQLIEEMAEIERMQLT